MKTTRVWLGVGFLGLLVFAVALAHFGWTLSRWRSVCRHVVTLPDVAIVRNLQERSDALSAYVNGYLQQCREGGRSRHIETDDPLSRQLNVCERWAKIEQSAVALKVSLPAFDVAACADADANKMSTFLHHFETVVQTKPIKIVDADYEREGAPPVWLPACPLWRDVLPYVKTTLIRFRVQAHFESLRQLLQIFAEDPVPCAIRNLAVTSLSDGLEYDVVVECVEKMEVSV